METVKRILQDKISERITPGKAVLIFGARRVGKTVMIQQTAFTVQPRLNGSRNRLQRPTQTVASTVQPWLNGKCNL